MSGDVDGIGTILSGGLAARAVEHETNPGSAGHAHAGAGGTCLNCGATRAGDFCQDCGQNGHTHRHVMAIGHDILHGVFHFEGKFWSTLPMLICHPGDLTRRYVHGERAKFVSPMALFLFSVFLLFAAVNRVSKPDVASVGQTVARVQEKIADRTKEAEEKVDELQADRREQLADDAQVDTSTLDKKIAAARQTVAALKTATAQLPASVAAAKGVGPITVGGDTYDFDMESGVKQINLDTGFGPIDRQIAHIKENPALYAYKLKMASYKYSWALIPISLPFIWIMFFWRRNIGLYDHAIFAIYSLSFMTLLAVGLIGLYMLGVSSGLLWLTFMIAPPIHMYKQLKGAYRLRRFSALWRTCWLLVTTTIAAGLFFAFLVWLEAE